MTIDFQGSENMQIQQMPLNVLNVDTSNPFLINIETYAF